VELKINLMQQTELQDGDGLVDAVCCCRSASMGGGGGGGAPRGMNGSECNN